MPLSCYLTHEEEETVCMNEIKNFPTINKARYVLVALAFVFLPPLAIGSLVMSQMPMLTPVEIEQLAGKSISYWLIALASLSVASWTFVVKWGLNQLEGQRSSNAQLVTQLVTYMKEDHTATLVVMREVTGVMERLISKMDRDDAVLAQVKQQKTT